jgi:hypothetical protein
MSKWIREHFKHLFYNPKRTQKRSGRRFQKAYEFYIDTLKKKAHWWDTKWVKATLPKAEARLKKYGITAAMVAKKIESKGLTDLLSKVM